jgi:hypothetical protein
MRAIMRAKFDFDPVGHYARPDVLSLVVHQEQRCAVRFMGADDVTADGRAPSDPAGVDDQGRRGCGNSRA